MNTNTNTNTSPAVEFALQMDFLQLESSLPETYTPGVYVVAGGAGERGATALFAYQLAWGIAQNNCGYKIGFCCMEGKHPAFRRFKAGAIPGTDCVRMSVAGFASFIETASDAKTVFIVDPVHLFMEESIEIALSKLAQVAQEKKIMIVAVVQLPRDFTRDYANYGGMDAAVLLRLHRHQFTGLRTPSEIIEGAEGKIPEFEIELVTSRFGGRRGQKFPLKRINEGADLYFQEI